MQVFTYICAILFLHLSNQEGFSVPSKLFGGIFVNISFDYFAKTEKNVTLHTKVAPEKCDVAYKTRPKKCNNKKKAPPLLFVFLLTDL